MKMCQSHWDKLRQAIKARGLNDFVPTTKAEVVANVAGFLMGRKETQQTFDPLMAANNMIFGNAIDFMSMIGANPMAMMQPPPEHPEFSCPLCFLNWLSAEHDRTCTNPECKKPAGMVFENWIGHAVDIAEQEMKALPKE